MTPLQHSCLTALLFTILPLCPLPIEAQTPDTTYQQTLCQQYSKKAYHPETPGLTLTYACIDKDDQINGYYTMKLLYIDGENGKRDYHYDQQFFKPDGSPVLKNNHLPLLVKTGEGPTFSLLKGWTRAIKTMDMVAKGDVNTMPGRLLVGTTLPESEIKLKVDNIGASLYTIGREVRNHQEIQVMAGQFDSFYLTETQEMHAVITIEENLETWYAKGIGAIKQSIYNKKGKLTRKMELVKVSITPENYETDIDEIIQIATTRNTDGN